MCYSRITKLASCLFLCIPAFAISVCCGKFDFGLAGAKVDVLESGKTVHSMEAYGIRVESTKRYFEWLCLKPSLLVLKGDTKRDLVINAALGIGGCIPVCKGFYLVPGVGIGYGFLRTSYHKDISYVELAPFPLTFKFKEHFHSFSPYAFLDAYYNFCDYARICGTIQYGYSRTWTTLDIVNSFVNDTELKTKGDSWGPSVSVMLEYDFICDWSINIGGAYNSSLTKEKHGLRAIGGKIGIAHWY